MMIRSRSCMARLCAIWINNGTPMIFNGQKWGPIDIDSSMITGRQLQLAIPANSIMPAQQSVIDAAIQNAASQCVKVIKISLGYLVASENSVPPPHVTTDTVVPLLRVQPARIIRIVANTKNRETVKKL
jgi:hypothetical protein